MSIDAIAQTKSSGEIVRWTTNKQQSVDHATKTQTVAVTYEGILYTYKAGVMATVNLAPVKRIYDFKI